MILGVGTDVVDIESFASQLNEPGSRFTDVFTGREQRTAKARAVAHTQPGASPEVAAHLAARWAAKESFIKAWSAALHGQPPVISEADLVWSEIEVIQDKWGRPSLAWHWGSHPRSQGIGWRCPMPPLPDPRRTGGKRRRRPRISRVAWFRFLHGLHSDIPR